jgi:hypothetical protein
MPGRPAGTAYCMACGHELPLWFTPETTDEEDDAVYEQWLDTPCPSCGTLPRAAASSTNRDPWLDANRHHA